jgi:predicted nucleotidyltransferase
MLSAIIEKLQSEKCGGWRKARYPKSSGRAKASGGLLKGETCRRGFARIANALTALYPKDSEDKRLLDATLVAGARLRKCIVSRIAKNNNAKTQIDRIVKRIVRKFHPEKIILFGSQARGDAGPDSDIDLLVVMPVAGSIRQKRLAVSLAVPHSPIPVDIIVTTPENLAWRKDIVGTIEWPAAREGKVLYARR